MLSTCGPAAVPSEAATLAIPASNAAAKIMSLLIAIIPLPEKRRVARELVYRTYYRLDGPSGESPKDFATSCAGVFPPLTPPPISAYHGRVRGYACHDAARGGWWNPE